MPTKTKFIKAKKARAPKNYRVRIRMYQQGLGDCFLLSFPKGDGGSVHVMIDCGVVLGTSEPKTVMQKIAKDVEKTTNKKVDVLVITHEHWDHLSGFTPGQAQKDFENIKFDRLWLAWTEDEKNALANALRTERELKKAAAVATKKKLKESAAKAIGPKAKALEKRVARLGAVMEFTGTDGDGGEGAGGTKGALDFLKGKAPGSKTETFKPGIPPFDLPGLPKNQVRVYVLGPPEDKEKLGKLNPGKEGFPQGKNKGFGSEMSLAGAYMAAFSGEGELAQPFPASFRKKMSDLNEVLGNRYLSADNQWRNIDDDWLAVGERLALQLDSDTNNTSLVLAFEFVESGDVLLFVGDAQAGNWLSWDEHTWQVRDGNGEKHDVKAEDLLRRTVFYKVGHHGSHNATLKEKGLYRMESGRLAAVIPVDENVAHDVKGWKHMPLPEIMDELKARCAVVFQSDKEPTKKPNTSGAAWDKSEETFEVRMKNTKTKKVETVREQNLYTDYFL